MKVPVVTALTDPRWEEGLVRELDRRDLGVTVVRRCVDVADVLAAAYAGTARAALVSADLRRLDKEAVARLSSSGVAVIGVVPSTDVPARARMRQLGVEHTVATGADPPDVSRAVLAAIAGTAQPHAAGDARDATPGALVAVWGPTGAPGRTTIAVNLAAEVAALGVPTSLADADTYGGAVALHVGLLDDTAGLPAAVRLANSGELTGPALAKLCRALSSHLRVLTGISRADRWPELRPSAYGAVLAELRRLTPMTVVDCGFAIEQDEELSYDAVIARRNAVTLGTLAAATHVVAVGAADPVGIARLARGLTELRERCHDLAPVTVVVNKVRSGVVAGDPERELRVALERHAAVAPDVFVPWDSKACDAALLAGRPLGDVARNSSARSAIAGLARTLNGAPRKRRWSRG